MRDAGQQRGGRCARGQQALEQRRRRGAIAETTGDAVGEPAEIFEQHEAEADRDRPELAESQDRGVLVRLDEAFQRLPIAAAVGVGDEGLGQDVDARAAAGKLRELAVVARR